MTNPEEPGSDRTRPNSTHRGSEWESDGSADDETENGQETDGDAKRTGQGDPARQSTTVVRRSVLRAAGVGAGIAAGPGVGLAGATESDSLTSHASAARSGLDLARARNAFYSQQAVAGKMECFRPDQREIYGPTDVSAQTGNGRLSVALNGAGTVTVYRWPRPSFYDQVKYYTLGRDDTGVIQVLPNEGAFLGVAIRRTETDTFETVWLRDLQVTRQYYGNDDDDTQAPYSDEVVTKYRGTGDRAGLIVTVRDLVSTDHDALVRHVRVHVPPHVAAARLVAFENFNLVVSKHPQYPIQDWCMEENNQDRARYLPDVDAIVHDKVGVDESTGEDRRVAVAMGFGGESTSHQIGGDAYEPAAEPAGHGGPTRDAYDDAAGLPLSGNTAYAGQTTGALATDLSFGKGEAGTATETVVIAAGETPAAATDTVDALRRQRFGTIRSEKEDWLASLLAEAPLPAIPEDDPAYESIMALSRRALVTLVTDTEDSANRATVASIATQAPYGEDWPRDGAYFNYALDLIGLHDWVADRNRFYADIQQRAGDPRPSHPNTPPGNWAMNYYGDGIAGGPIPYEIDETGYATWTMWDHYTVTEDSEYLEEVYPAIRRAAEFLVECQDPSNGLHCHSWEDDRFAELRQTIVGAALVWKGLDAAAQAAGELGRSEERDRYSTRREEVGTAIDTLLFDEAEGMYGARAGFPMAEVAWPICFTPYVDDGDGTDEPAVTNPLDHHRIQSHLDSVWKSVEPTFNEPEAGVLDTGQYEAKGLIPLAKARRDSGSGRLDQVREGVRWLATEHATPDTHVMGEAWQVFQDGDGDREVRSIVSQPHAWEQIITYLAALEAWPPIEEFDGGTCGSVLEALRERNAPD